jgi:hypothetical protein
MSGRRSREKGAAWERAVVNKFRYCMPDVDLDIKRGLQYRTGEETADIDMPVFWPECKAHKRVNIKAALRQAADTAPKGRIPVAITKDDRQAPLATLLLDDFLDLVREWWMRR